LINGESAVFGYVTSVVSIETLPSKQTAKVNTDELYLTDDALG